MTMWRQRSAANGSPPASWAASLYALMGCIALPCAAQTAITPGSVQQSLPPALVDAPRLPSQMVFPDQPQPPPFDPSDQRFVVNAFDVHGATVFSRLRLKRVLARFLDLEVNLYDLNRAADDLTWYYHAHGYPLARAYVPAQTVKNGVVRIEMVEGRIGSVRISGNRRYSEEFLKARLPHLREGQIVYGLRLEQDLLGLNALPGLNSRVVLSPSAMPGATDADLQIRESLVNGGVLIDNFGREQTGQWRLQGSLNLNSPLGWGDRFSFMGMKTNGNLINYWSLAYSLPLNARGWRLDVTNSRVGYDVQGLSAALNVHGRVDTSSVQLQWPLSRSRASSSSVTVGYKLSHSSQSALGVEVASNHHSVLDTAYSGNWTHDDSSSTQLRLGLASNFRQFATTTGENNVMARFEIDIDHVAPWTKDWDVKVHANAVYSPDALPDSEKFGVGGPGSVRAFQSSEIRGDSGHLLSVEVRRTLPVGNTMVQPRITFDSGTAIYKAPDYRDSSETLRSVGLGVSVFPTKDAQISMDWARALGSSRVASDGSPSRFWVKASVNF